MMIALYLYLALYIAASLLASSLWKSTLWGLSSWGIVSLATAVAAAIIVVLVQIVPPPARLRLHAPVAVPSIKRHLVVSAVVSCILLSILRVRHDYWGSGRIVADAVEQGVLVTAVAPLGMMLSRLFFMLVNSTFILTGKTAMALLGAGAGVGYTLCAVHAARLIHGEREYSSGLIGVTTAVLLANGSLVVFFGAAAIIPLTMLASLLFIIAALGCVRGETKLWIPSLLLLLAVFSHLSAVYLAAGFVYILILHGGTPERRRQAWTAAIVLAAAAAAIEVTVWAATGSSGPVRRLFTILGESLVAPGGAGTGWSAGGPLLVNLFLLSGPATVTALLLLVFPGKRPANDAAALKALQQGRLLAVLTVSAILLYIGGGGRVNSGLRWDLFAAASPAFALFVVQSLRTRLRQPARFYRAALLLAGLGVFHCLPWLIVNVSPGAAERRLLSLPLEPGRAEMILAMRALEAESTDRAVQWFKASIGKDDRNDLAYYHLGTIEMGRDMYSDAITYFYKAHSLKPESTEYAYKLTEAYLGKPWFPEAIELLEGLTASHPDSVRFWRTLGYAANNNRMHEEAIAAYEKALALEPDDEQNVKNLVSAVLNRGAELQTEGDLEGARKLYNRAIRLYPYEWVGYNNLATVEMELGNYEKAKTILEQAIKIHPLTPSIALNMGLVLEKLGNKQEALGYIRRSVELDPLETTNARQHLLRILEGLSEFPVDGDTD